MLRIVRDLAVEPRFVGIDEEVVVARSGPVYARWRHAHLAEAEADGRSRVDVIPVPRVDEEDARPRWTALAHGRARWSRCDRCRLLLGGDDDPDSLRNYGRVMGEMIMVAEQQLQHVFSGRKRDFSFRL